MKNILPALVLLLPLFGSRAQVVYEYTYPYQLTDTTAFVEEFNQGLELYRFACSHCHTSYKNNAEQIPDFSLPQLMDYEIVVWPQHAEQIPVITHEELEKIITFLRYKLPAASK